MRLWDKVHSVENITLTVGNVQNEVTLYGNTRNCVAIIIYFNGRDSNNQIINLSKEELGIEDVQLIDQDTGKELSRDFARNGADKLIYSIKKSIYCPGLIESSSSSDPNQAKLTYYVYALAQAKHSKTIGARFVFCASKKVEPYDTTQDDRNSKLVNIHIVPEINYRLSDIQQLKWVEEKRISEYAVQWNLFVKLKEYPKNRWVRSEFDCEQLHIDGLPVGSFACQNNEKYGYYYILNAVHLTRMPISVITKGNGQSARIDVQCNSEPGALNIIMVRGHKAKSVVKPEGVISLFDSFGNEGKFQLDWFNYLRDPTELSIKENHWNLLNSVQDISFTVDGSTEIATLYGNTRHCIEVTMSFTGKDKNGDIIDLSGDSFNSKMIRLVNQDTGNEISEKHDAPKVNDIYYSQQTSRFCLNLDNAYSSEVKPTGTYNTTSDKGKVTYYVYASAIQVFKIKIGAKFLFANDKTYSTADDNRTSKFAIVNVQPKREYTTDNLEPFSYEQTAKDSDWAVQWDAYIKLKDNVHWVYSEFDNYEKLGKQGYFASHSLDYGRGYFYFMWPVRKEGVYELKRDNGDYWMTVKYNKIPGALNIVMIKGHEDGVNHGNVDIRLYDAYGNEGKFKLDWNNTLTDSTEATVVNA